MNNIYKNKDDNSKKLNKKLIEYKLKFEKMPSLKQIIDDKIKSNKNNVIEK